MRHGEAQSVDSCPEDFERALTRRGVHQAREMAARIVRRSLSPDLILVSPAERTWATAAILAAACELDAKQLLAARELYLASPETVWRLVGQQGSRAKHLLICGHNPGLSQLASRFGPARAVRELPTAGIATAVWPGGEWTTFEPETAALCELDDPDSPAD
jgi:phosphohistidine phosphatase